jgi:hypothetical protein
LVDAISHAEGLVKLLQNESGQVHSALERVFNNVSSITNKSALVGVDLKTWSENSGNVKKHLTEVGIYLRQALKLCGPLRQVIQLRVFLVPTSFSSFQTAMQTAYLIDYHICNFALSLNKQLLQL